MASLRILVCRKGRNGGVGEWDAPTTLTSIAILLECAPFNEGRLESIEADPRRGVAQPG